MKPRIMRLTPFFNNVTLKFSKRPRWMRLSFMYVKSWASWIGWSFSTVFNSTTSRPGMTRSMTKWQSSGVPL